MAKNTLQVPATDARNPSVNSDSRFPADISGRCDRPSARSSGSHPSTSSNYDYGGVHSCRATVGHQHPPLTEREAWFLSARYLKLGIGTSLGAVALFLSSNDGLNKYLYGNNWERAWIWWTVTVPFYLFCIIYFTRFVGSYLMRIWTWEIVNSPWVHEAVITLLAGILSEETADDLLTAALAKPAVIEGVSTLTAALINSDAVQSSSVQTVVGVLTSPKVQDAAVVSTEKLFADPGLIRALAELLGNETFAEPVARQVARILDHEVLGSALIAFIGHMLENQGVREVMRRRAKSMAGDAQLFRAGRKGAWESMVGPANSRELSSEVARPAAVLEVPYSSELSSEIARPAAILEDSMVGPCSSRDSGCMDTTPCHPSSVARITNRYREE